MPRPVMKNSLSISEARRMALAGQGFADVGPKEPGRVRLANLIRRLGLLQLDFVNLVLPSHYLIPFSRLGPYERADLDHIIYKAGDFTEQWAHEASVLPMETWPLLHHRRQKYRHRPWGYDGFVAENPDYIDGVLQQIAARGPLGADDLNHPEHIERKIEGSWIGTAPRAALEYHFAEGRLAATGRRKNFARVYDLAERIIPDEHRLHEPDEAEAQRTLIQTAARAHGVATPADLADYWRMPVRTARMRIGELLEEGALEEVRVEGWKEPAYTRPGTEVPQAIEARALLSPFDPVIWRRPRAARLFGFDFRFEIFIPKAKRKWGAYVLPFLMGDKLVARVDLKAERKSGHLQVIAAYREGHANEEEVARALAQELKALAHWLGLKRVKVGRKGNLARALGKSIKHSV